MELSSDAERAVPEEMKQWVIFSYYFGSILAETGCVLMFWVIVIGPTQILR